MMTPATKIGIALTLVIAVILIARASDHDRHEPIAAVPGQVSIGQVSQHLESEGYRIRKIKEDNGRYKATVLTSDRHKEKLSISPRTGDIISRRHDDGDDD
jgi:hypothetical protein